MRVVFFALVLFLSSASAEDLSSPLSPLNPVSPLNPANPLHPFNDSGPGEQERQEKAAAEKWDARVRGAMASFAPAGRFEQADVAQVPSVPSDGYIGRGDLIAMANDARLDADLRSAAETLSLVPAFQRMDTDANGLVDWDEFVTRMIQKVPNSRNEALGSQALRDTFAILDNIQGGDPDSVVSREDLLLGSKDKRISPLAQRGLRFLAVPAVFNALETADLPKRPADGLASIGDFDAYHADTMAPKAWRAILQPLWNNRVMLDTGDHPHMKADGYVSQADFAAIALDPTNPLDFRRGAEFFGFSSKNFHRLRHKATALFAKGKFITYSDIYHALKEKGGKP